MERWSPVGDPLEAVHSAREAELRDMALQKVAHYGRCISALQGKVSDLEMAMERPKAAPRGRQYKKWKNGLTPAEHALLAEHGFKATAAEPGGIAEMKELVRSARNLKSACNSRARAREASKRSVPPV